MRAPVVSHFLKDDGSIPNNDRLPLLVYPAAFADLAPLTARAVEDRFHANGWGNSWVNGVFRYHHYHAEAHEVLGCVGGSATVLFGGDNGVEVQIGAGDAVLIPAGVGHKNLGCSLDFRVVGAYPPGQSPDMKYGEPGERSDCFASIAAVSVPERDPIYGTDGGLAELWPSGQSEI